MPEDRKTQAQATNAFDASRQQEAPRASATSQHEYQQRLLSTLIRWTSCVFGFGILINSVWFLLDFWNTLIQEALVLLLLLIGCWCIRQTNQGKVVRAGRVYLGSAMALISLLTLVLGERFILNAVIALGLMVFIATFLEPERVALRWGVLSIALYVMVLTVRILLPTRELTIGTADLFGLYAFPVVALSATGLLGSNAARLLSTTLAETQAAHQELKRSHRLLQGTEAELQVSHEQLRRQLSQRRLAEEALAQKVEELSRSRGLIAALSQVAARIDSAPALDQIMETLGSELSEAGVTCIVALLDPDDRALEVRYTSIPPSALAMGEKLTGIRLDKHRVPRGVEIMYGMIQRGSPVFLADALPLMTAALPGVPGHRVRRLIQLVGLHPAAAMCLPLMVDDEAVGILAVWGPGLQEDDLPALSVFATQVATAIQTAGLRQAEERRREELVIAYQRLEQVQRDLAKAESVITVNRL